MSVDQNTGQEALFPDIEVVKAGVSDEPVYQPATVAPPRDELERLDPAPLKLALESGTAFDLEPLKLRQFLRLLRIVTRGAADVLDQAELDFNDPQAFMQTFLGMVLFSIPEAEEETVDFIKSVVRPSNLTGDAKKDLALVQSLSAELDNPELEDTITIVQALVEREAEDLRALGKRLAGMLRTAEKLGATKSDAPTPNI